MKFRFIGIILAAALAVSFAACDSGGAKSTESSLAEASSEELEPLEIPDIVAGLTEEENNTIVGSIKDGVYYNEYFGIRLVPGEGQTVVRDNDQATGNAEPISLADTYTKGWGSISVTSATEDWGDRINITINDCGEGEDGLSEKELAEKRLQSFREIDALFDDTEELNEDDGRSVETVTLAGEEHDVVISRYESSASVSWITVKDGFKMIISFNHIGDQDLSKVLACIEGL